MLLYNNLCHVCMLWLTHVHSCGCLANCACTICCCEVGRMNAVLSSCAQTHELTKYANTCHSFLTALLTALVTALLTAFSTATHILANVSHILLPRLPAWRRTQRRPRWCLRPVSGATLSCSTAIDISHCLCVPHVVARLQTDPEAAKMVFQAGSGTALNFLTAIGIIPCLHVPHTAA